LSALAILGGGLGNKENSPRHELFVVINIEATPSVLGYRARGADTSRAPLFAIDNNKLLLRRATRLSTGAHNIVEKRTIRRVLAMLVVLAS